VDVVTACRDGRDTTTNEGVQDSPLSVFLSSRKFPGFRINLWGRNGYGGETFNSFYMITTIKTYHNKHIPIHINKKLLRCYIRHISQQLNNISIIGTIKVFFDRITINLVLM